MAKILECVPCRERGKKGIPSTRNVAGTPMCRECFGGDDEPHKSTKSGAKLFTEEISESEYRQAASRIGYWWRKLEEPINLLQAGKGVRIRIEDGTTAVLRKALQNYASRLGFAITTCVPKEGGYVYAYPGERFPGKSSSNTR